MVSSSLRLLLFLILVGCTPSNRELGTSRGDKSGSDRSDLVDGVNTVEQSNGQQTNGQQNSTQQNNSNQQVASGSNTPSTSTGTPVVGPTYRDPSLPTTSPKPGSSQPGVPDLGGSQGSGGSANQCSRAPVRLGGVDASDAFGLVGNATEALEPLSMVMRIHLTSGATRDCTAVAYNIKHGLAPAKDNSAVSGTMRVLNFPRLSVAQHCLAIEDKNEKVVKIDFRSPTDLKQVWYEYELDASGATRVVGKQVSGPWYIDPVALANVTDGQNADRDPCTLAQRKTPIGDYSCFAARHDRLDLIHTAERDARAGVSALSGFYALDVARVRALGTDGFFDGQQASSGGPSWAQIFADRRSRFVTPLSYDYDLGLAAPDYAFAGFFPQSKDQAYQMMNANLEQIAIVSSILRNGEKATHIVRPQNGDWRQVLDLYGTEGATTYRRGSPYSYFRIDGIGIRGDVAKLGKGHSGTMMIAKWRRVTAPLATGYEYRQQFGLLSTVAGEDVCLGDDLNCCEKVR